MDPSLHSCDSKGIEDKSMTEHPHQRARSFLRRDKFLNVRDQYNLTTHFKTLFDSQVRIEMYNMLTLVAGIQWKHKLYF